MKITLIVFGLLISYISNSQNIYEYSPPEKTVLCKPGENVVISLNGLKLRDKPDSFSKVLTIIPFSELVVVISRNEKEHDILVDEMWGKWVNVKYKNDTGYVFSAYLSNDINKMTESYYLLVPNGGCGENNYFSSSYNYYGFFQSEYSDATEIKKIVPVFYTTGYRTVVMIDSIIQPLFVIASKSEMKEGRDNSSCSFTNLFSTPDYSLTKGKRIVGLNNGEFLLEVENFISADTILKKLILKDRQTQKVQLISESFFSFQLIWDGDLDNDGKPDFIIFSGGEKGGAYQLFLSGKAPKGKFVRMVATFDSGICC
ncbi:MAG TPA: SH3 domain-containing protein [Bacteroidia bacterium]|nr:SH3 domain-containing protein [Bacteroidia bacterium]HNU32590.1 SH3 domain-containing protein [Bacteroidia bacterium]